MLLLDTQIVIWLAADSDRISKRATREMSSARNNDGLAVAGVTLWEIVTLQKKGRLDFLPTVDHFLASVESTYTVLSLDAAIALRAMRLTDKYPKDPADRQIGATALVHGLQLITSDGPIRESGEVPCIW